ncbi:fimbrial protein [Yersinia ruckeri]|uniref:fimbrial protein n=1 Tax=Yersinia ruckeri TaxID=29486 RepID=UPI0022385193|nr:fimbrial protein [Yersinia ruckeri]MCW6649442.1 fimbrial protein [Yersinia ruckeri]
MFNLKNKPLATGYFTKKSFSLLTVAIIGYLLTPAASASSPSADCIGHADNITMRPDVVLTYDRSGAEIASYNIFSTADFKFKFICSLSENIYYELKVENGVLVNGYSDVFETNIPGVGVRYALAPGPYCTQNPGEPMKGECDIPKSQGDLMELYPKLSLVHYGDAQNLPQGEVTIRQNLTVNYTRRNQSNPVVLGQINIPALTYKYKRRGCTLNTPEVKLNFGKVQASEFSGVKSTSQPSTADKIYLNCDPDTSYFLTIQGKSVASHPDILELDQTSGQANGIGVQLEAGDSSKAYQKMILNEETYMHKTGNNGSATNKHIDIRARYFQTENKIAPGTANASATFTITYQ